MISCFGPVTKPLKRSRAGVLNKAPDNTKTQRLSTGSNHNSDHRAGYLAQLSVSVSHLDADNAKKMFNWDSFEKSRTHAICPRTDTVSFRDKHKKTEVMGESFTFQCFLKRWSLTSSMLMSHNEKQKEIQTYSVKKEAHLNMNAAGKCCFNLYSSLQ